MNALDRWIERWIDRRSPGQLLALLIVGLLLLGAHVGAFLLFVGVDWTTALLCGAAASAAALTYCIIHFVVKVIQRIRNK